MKHRMTWHIDTSLTRHLVCHVNLRLRTLKQARSADALEARSELVGFRDMSFWSSPFAPVNEVNAQKVPFLLRKLESCKSMQELKEIHASVIKTRAFQTHIVWTKLVSFCALNSHGDLDYALSAFTQIRNPSLDLYNIIIRGFSRGSFSKKKKPLRSLFLYREMLEKGFVPDSFTLPFVLKACAESRALREGEAVHVHSIKTGLLLDVYVKNNLMRMYAVCGSIRDAQKLFDESPHRDLVSWTTLIQGYASMGFFREAIRVFLEMSETDLIADGKTMVVVLSACSKLGDLELGREINRYMNEHMVNSDVFVMNALVDMYLKCGDVGFACKLFEEMPEKNVVSWNSMISGLAQQGEFKEALSVFRRMQNEGIKPDDITMVCVLNSCANLGALELGEWVHTYIDRNQVKADGFIGNALVDMYAKCGRIDQAFRVFKAMKHRDVYSYTAMIVGFAMHGQGEKALALFSEMSRVGVKPDEVTFIGVLSACSHVGLVKEGRKHFNDMSRLYNLRPQVEHYGCMVDLLGRAGFISEAEELIRIMPLEPDAFVWGALLGACRIHGEVELGESIMRRLVEMDPERDGAYILMSNIYASANRWRDAVMVRKEMKEKKMKKVPGCSLIELEGVVHEFRKGDKSHPKMKEIHMMLEEIMSRLRCEGHVAVTTSVLADVSDEEKENALCHHSERLAIALGLISTRPGTPLRIVKNLRVCGDCHSVTKLISRVFGREIVVRDRIRFHHFRGGLCSCKEYW